MARATTQFVCQACGTVHSKWAGQCQGCHAWDTLAEESTSASSKAPSGQRIERYSFDHSITAPARIGTGFSEFDRALGGGLVPGSAILIGGEPGIGKSTLLLQVMASLSQTHACLYISGEESLQQITLRATRLGCASPSLQVAIATELPDILVSLQEWKPQIIVIDSIQTLHDPALSSAPGSVGQVRESAHALIQWAKAHNTVLFLVGHVTKEGHIAGPKLLEHMVDSVLYFETESTYAFRVVRAVKNRFGAVNEIGVFEMGEKGLTEVTNPSGHFVRATPSKGTGIAVFPTIEGTRPILVEVQALVAPTTMSYPRRAVVGWDSNRLSMLLAVLATRYGLRILDKEIYLNIAGGLKVLEPAADLAVAAALISASTNAALPPNSVYFGEIGLSGEVRAVSQSEIRLKEAAKLGYKQAYVPPECQGVKGITLHDITHIKQVRASTVDA